MSGLKLHKVFAEFLPKRINPGEKNYDIEDILKVNSGSGHDTSDFSVALDGAVIEAGTYKKASSITVAENAKVIENTRR